MMFGIGYITKEIRPCTKALFYEAVRSRHVKETESSRSLFIHLLDFCVL